MNNRSNSTAHKLSQTIAALRERHYQSRQRTLALENRFKALSVSETSYVAVNGDYKLLTHF